ncbi:hypothetical protein NE237_007132 [Protea cynaroides]|uniref:Uncharacterized protein n=1 Tax=Protea cynaroides TaxID=273540 RepID=A0A9Q0KNQ3_9MAGN|nr:hypothetical protein NE237_007132 [Protea cynaroides]
MMEESGETTFQMSTKIHTRGPCRRKECSENENALGNCLNVESLPHATIMPQNRLFDLSLTPVLSPTTGSSTPLPSSALTQVATFGSCPFEHPDKSLSFYTSWRKKKLTGFLNR